MSLFYTDVVGGGRPNPEFLFILEHVLKEKTSLPTFGICVTNTAAVPVLYPFFQAGCSSRYFGSNYLYWDSDYSTRFRLPVTSILPTTLRCLREFLTR